MDTTLGEQAGAIVDRLPRRGAPAVAYQQGRHAGPGRPRQRLLSTARPDPLRNHPGPGRQSRRPRVRRRRPLELDHGVGTLLRQCEESRPFLLRSRSRLVIADPRRDPPQMVRVSVAHRILSGRQRARLARDGRALQAADSAHLVPPVAQRRPFQRLRQLPAPRCFLVGPERRGFGCGRCPPASW